MYKIQNYVTIKDMFVRLMTPQCCATVALSYSTPSVSFILAAWMGQNWELLIKCILKPFCRALGVSWRPHLVRFFCDYRTIGHLSKVVVSKTKA